MSKPDRRGCISALRPPDTPAKHALRANLLHRRKLVLGSLSLLLNTVDSVSSPALGLTE